jgi:hypothetical protein
LSLVAEYAYRIGDYSSARALANMINGTDQRWLLGQDAELVAGGIEAWSLLHLGDVSGARKIFETFNAFSALSTSAGEMGKEGLAAVEQAGRGRPVFEPADWLPRARAASIPAQTLTAMRKEQKKDNPNYGMALHERDIRGLYAVDLYKEKDEWKAFFEKKRM